MHNLPTLETSSLREKQDSEEKRAIYIGNLPQSIDDATLSEIFSISGSIHSIKLIGKSALNTTSSMYAFVEYDDPASAENAIETFNGRTVLNTPIKVNWAYQSTTSANAREETSTHFTIFVGDLATEVNDESLRQAFSTYGSISDARIMWDMTTGRSRGYGFVSFVERSDAEAALEEMPGKWLGSRSIRCNWANQKQTMPTTPIEVLATSPAREKLDVTQQFAIVGCQAPYTLTTIYVGNLALDTEADDLSPLFDSYGTAKGIRMHCNRGFAFVTLDSHESASLAIVQLQGVIVKGRPIKCSWQLKPDSLPRQRSKSNAQATQPMVPTLPMYPASQYSLQAYAHNHSAGSRHVPRSISALPRVMSSEQIIALQLLQQQQTLVRLGQQMAAMTSVTNQ